MIGQGNKTFISVFSSFLKTIASKFLSRFEKVYTETAWIFKY